MGINRRQAIGIADFQFIVEKHRILPERRLGRTVNIRKQAALQGFTGHGIEPLRFRRFHNDGAK